MVRKRDLGRYSVVLTRVLVVLRRPGHDLQTSRDERRARALNIPIPTFDIINLPIDEFNERLAKYDLTEAQLSLIRDIRRRGKNKVCMRCVLGGHEFLLLTTKVAAQNCRKRKMDQIVGLQGEVEVMLAQKENMRLQYERLTLIRQQARDKYAKLYNLILESTRGTSDDAAGRS